MQSKRLGKLIEKIHYSHALGHDARCIVNLSAEMARHLRGGSPPSNPSCANSSCSFGYNISCTNDTCWTDVGSTANLDCTNNSCFGS
jgi:hypothetical protein